MKSAFIFLATVLFSASLKAQTIIRVPHSGATVMVDGTFDPAEWKDAYRLTITDSLKLLIKQDKENIYWCLQGLHHPAILGGVNFYITQKDSLLNLHASAKLGERQMVNGSYGNWVWWNNRDWVATVARPDKIEERKFLRDEVKEFQLRKTRFGDTTMRMMFDIEFPQHLLPRFPLQADTTVTTHWLVLNF